MKSNSITIQVEQGQQGRRVFRFDKPEILIGFSPECHVSLEPHNPAGGEIALVTNRNRQTVLKVKTNPGAFKLNGNPWGDETALKAGDVLTSDSYRITIADLPAPAESADPASGVAGQGGRAAARPYQAAAPAPAGVDQEAATVPALDLDCQAMNLAGDGNGAASAKPSAAEEKEEGATMPGDPALAQAAANAVPLAPAAAVSQSGAAPQPAPTPAPPQKKVGLEYLYLFFAPIKEHLMDDDVAEVMINGPRQIFIERKGKLTSIPAKFSSETALQAAVMNVARSVGRFFDKDNPRLDARLPDGSRVHAVMPPLCRAGTVVAIRKFRKEKLTIQQLIQFGSLSPESAQLIDVIVKIGKNLIVSGATSSGKTSVLNVLSGLIPEHDRILVLEDASELQLQQPHAVCFETRKADEHGKGEVSIRDLLHSALRLRPDRLVVGEIRGGEALDLLQAMNTGHDGSMSTIHANTARDSLFRLETCALLSGVEIPLAALREQTAAAIHIVIQTARLFDGTRKITAITEVLGLKDREYQLQDIVLFEQEGMSADGRIVGKHTFTGYKPTFMKAAQQRGLNVEGLFG